jgi:LruC domain-containing protein
MKNFKYYFILCLLIVFASCERNDLDTQEPEGISPNVEGVSIPDGFNFETDRAVALNIVDDTPFVKYQVFAYSDRFGSEAENISEALDHILFSGKLNNGSISVPLTLSNMYDKVYISRKDGIEYTFEIKDISNNVIDFNIPPSNRYVDNSSSANRGNRALCGCDSIMENGRFGEGPLLPTIGGNPIQPDEDDVEGWNTTASDSKIEIWPSGYTGVIAQKGDYFAELNATQPSALYQRICTTPGATIDWSVYHRARVGTDVATVKFGTDLATATIVQTMTTTNVAWVQYSGTYVVPAGQLDTFMIFEAVSAAGGLTRGNFIDDVVLVETAAGDPCDGNYTIFFPGGIDTATLAFEDLWPSQGDYDFNDLTISYRTATRVSIVGDFVQSMDYIYAIGCLSQPLSVEYTNGFGIELESTLISNVVSVTGQNLTGSVFTLNGSGAESGKINAVIPIFDDAEGTQTTQAGLPTTVSINLDGTQDLASFGSAPLNPFLVENQARNWEVHLADKATTFDPVLAIAIPGFAPAFAQVINDSTGDFKVDSNVVSPSAINMPWALSISGPFACPLPETHISEGYNHFNAWVTSGGTSFKTWFLDLPGYRNPASLESY